MSESAPKTIRCAVYTRKSTAEGLEQEFNSLDAQRLAGEAYIASQAGAGWVCLPHRYDDGGFTGANVERPAFKRLMSDVASGGIDCIVLYKVDRLSRSLMDFARIMETLERHGVSFVSVTQHFNTSQSMGRLTLNILLSFAQFEREIISERTRDKIAAARRAGYWSGGIPPLGYDIDRSNGSIRLVINPSEADRVRRIFELYLEQRSLLKVTRILDQRGWRTKRWITRKGHQRGGRWIVEQVGDSAGRRDVAVVDKDAVLRDAPRVLGLMADQHDGQPGGPAQLVDQVEHLEAQCRAHRGERFVEQQDGAFAHQAAGQRDALALAARELSRQALLEAGQADTGERRADAAVVVVRHASLKRYPPADAGVGSARIGQRDACFDDARGLIPCPVYERALLRPGHGIAGPAIIDQPDSTTVVYPGQHAEVDDYGNLVIATL